MATLKSAALNHLQSLAEATGPTFARYAKAAMSVVAHHGPGCEAGHGLLSFKYHPEIRKYGAYTVFEAYKAMAKAVAAADATTREGSMGELRVTTEAALAALGTALVRDKDADVSAAFALSMMVRQPTLRHPSQGWWPPRWLGCTHPLTPWRPRPPPPPRSLRRW